MAPSAPMNRKYQSASGRLTEDCFEGVLFSVLSELSLWPLGLGQGAGRPAQRSFLPVILCRLWGPERAASLRLLS